MNSPSQSFFSAALPPEELAAILQRIDENLAQRAVVEDVSFATSTVTAVLPNAHELASRLQSLREQRAPLFVVHGRAPADLLRRILNLPIRVFGYKQARFNTDLLNLVDQMLLSIQGARQKIAQQEAEIAQLQSELERLAGTRAQPITSKDQG